jgi:CheY-like chemotaxis protein
MGRANLILIVDDDVDFRLTLRQVLEDEGCIVRDAADGKAALLAIKEAIPDLVILDLMMPVMNGWDLYAELQREPLLAAIPVAVLSGVARMRPFGAMHEIHKPVDLPSLLGLLQAIETPSRPSRASRLPPA